MKKSHIERFNERHQKGERAIKLEEKVDMLRCMKEELGITISERQQRRMLAYLDEILFALEQNGGYTPAHHMLAYHLICEIGFLTNISGEDLEGYVDRYRKMEEKNSGNIAFNRNFG